MMSVSPAMAATPARQSECQGQVRWPISNTQQICMKGSPLRSKSNDRVNERQTDAAASTALLRDRCVARRSLRRPAIADLPRRALGENPLQSAAMHIQPPRGFRDVAVTHLVDTL